MCVLCASQTQEDVQTPILDAWDGYIIECMPDFIDNESPKVHHHQQNRKWRRE